jgi:hypothetical protein
VRKRVLLATIALAAIATFAVVQGAGAMRGA